MGPCIVPQPEVGPAGLSCAPMAASAHDLALRYLLELSADIRGRAAAGPRRRAAGPRRQLPADDLAAVGQRLARRALAGCRRRRRRSLRSRSTCCPPAARCSCSARPTSMMACVTNRNVHPGLIFYDMHAVLRDLDRAAAAEAARRRAARGAGSGREAGRARAARAATPKRSPPRCAAARRCAARACACGSTTARHGARRTARPRRSGCWRSRAS